MKFVILRPRPDQWLLSATLLAVFVIAGCVAFDKMPGEDLASSYVGCRLLASGQANHLYSYDPISFDEIGDDDTWQNVADAGGYKGALHPYVQTPLWAYVLQPLCRHTQWTAFFRVFAFLSMLSLAGCLWLVAKHWAPSFFGPLAFLAVLLFWVPSQPFQYAAYLMQTHILLIYLTIAGLILAEKGRWLPAGLLIACAAAVKITPALLVIYWILTKRWKAAISMLVWSAALWGLTVFAVGRHLTDVYLADLHRISHVLIVPMNNQSFAAWMMSSHYSPDEVFDVREFSLPTVVRFASSVLMIVFTVFGGWIDRKRMQQQSQPTPVGAMMALVAATVFAPIAWTHYSVILVFPLLVLIHENLRIRSKWIWGAAAVTILLNYRPISTDINHFLFGQLSIIRAQFYAWLLALVSLAAVSYLNVRRRNTLRHVHGDFVT